MKYALAMAALAAPVVIAAPAKRQGANIDTTVLQFALTLEHLENVFYNEALQKFSSADFLKAGYGPNYYNNLKYIAADEQSHVQFLQSALSAAGQTPTGQCTYNFPYTDVQSFVGLSSVLEGVGTSAYLGGAPLITSKDYLTAAGSILVTEALHTSLQRSAVNEIPFGSPYGTPLDPTSVYTLAAAFIKSCPDSNPALPFTPFPSLSLATTAGSCEQVDCSPQIFQKRDGGDWQQWSEEYSSYEGGNQGGYGYDGEHGGDYEHGGDNGYDGDYEHGGDYEHDGGYEHGGDYEHGAGHDSGYEHGDNSGKDADYNHGGDSGYNGGNNGKPSPDSSAKNMPALRAGQSAMFTAASAVPAASYLTFVSGLDVVSVPATISGNNAVAPIPSEAMGQTYVFITSAAAAGKLDGSTVLFGPAILEVAPAAPVY